MIYERQIHPIAYPRINTSSTTNCQPLRAIGMMRLMDLENIHPHTHTNSPAHSCGIVANKCPNTRKHVMRANCKTNVQCGLIDLIVEV